MLDSGFDLCTSQREPASSLKDRLPPARPLESNKGTENKKEVNQSFIDSLLLQTENVLADKELLPTTTADSFTKTRPFEPPLQSSRSKYKLPSLDTSQLQAGQLWPGATGSSSSLAFPPSHTLPTPPTTESDVFRPPSHNRNNDFHVGAAAVRQQPSMTATMESAGASQSLTARRSAASNLPNFELPPPSSISQKFLTYNSSSIPTTQSTPAMVSVGNLLTPPSQVPGGSLSPISSAMSNNGNGNQNVQPYTPTGGFWPPPGTGQNPFSLTTGTTPQPWNQGPINPLCPPRGVFSPSLQSLVRNSSHSPSSADGLPPPPPYDMNQLPPFPGTISMPSPSNLPPVASQHSQQALAQYMNNVQSPMSAQTSQASPVNGPDSYRQQPPPTPTYYSGSQPSSTPQSSQFPPFHNHSPVQQSPLSASTNQGSRISPLGAQNAGMQQQQQQQPPPNPHQANSFVRPYSQYTLPMAGPIMSNQHNPGGQMAMVGMPTSQGLPGNIMPGFNSGASAQMQQMYGGHHHPAVAPLNERPFKCDQCPQSFNRNHDLKRHKRIHLAVKPFPCGHCDKSFSRKDALKVSSMVDFTLVLFDILLAARAN
ncbi:MAG: hypothetical protein LQ337_001125 [Flavoplaca oasis]|nr:MAG: hypothetical protein LQ337_001125 [Flavoplaca oasis]